MKIFLLFTMMDTNNMYNLPKQGYADIRRTPVYFKTHS